MNSSPHKTNKTESLKKGPAIFSDIGREAKDLLTKGYIKDDVFSISTRSNSRAVHTLTTAVKRGRHSTSNVAATYKNSTVDVKIDSNSHVSAAFGFRGKFSSSTRSIFTLKLPDYSSSELKLQCFHGNAVLSSSFVLNKFPAVVISAAIGIRDPRIAVGVEAEYKRSSGGFTKYDAGIHVVNPKCNASIILANKGDLLKASYVHHFQQPMKIAVAAEISRRLLTKENTLTVGGSCEVNRTTTLKVKLNNHGKINTLLMQKTKTKSSLSISGEIDTIGLDKTPRFGLAVALVL